MTATSRWICLACMAGVAAWAGAAAAQQIKPIEYDRLTPVVRAFQAAKDAVVNISTTRIVKSSFFGFEDDAFDDIFQSPFARNVPVQSLGSGFLIHPEGYIVTNEHVVRRAMQITVSFADKSTRQARIIATDPTHDLAILKIDPAAGKELPALPIGRSDDLMIGETVIAIGNPKGYEHSVTSGIVSALGRELEFGGKASYTGLIQTDAPINAGNSGGPLLNVNAEVVGITTAIRPDAQGIGFAIAADDFTKDLPNLLNFERLHRLVLGLEVEQRRSGQKSVLVLGRVDAGSPAEKAGAKAGQVLLAVDGEPAGTLAGFYVHMLGKRPGDTVALRVAPADGAAKATELSIRLAERPKPDGVKLASKWLGLSLQPIAPETAERLGLAGDRGLLVGGVVRDSPAGRLGVRIRDVLFQLGGDYVGSLDDMGKVLEDVQPGQVLRIGIVRGNVRYWTQLRLGEAAETAPAGLSVSGRLMTWKSERQE